jgi:hypothetical protein
VWATPPAARAVHSECVNAPTLPTVELMYRESADMSVALLWNREDGTLKVSVREVSTGNPFELVVGEEEALDAFYHPYAYAARRD